ncbi:hypothetical protein AUJ77_01145 [Candidatus Nomurabacteria bacterium CG1_02_43_90]|uniref:histidine kinase n=1 Tax=Candidatus Nomurabacteria bacterium CG1_02_43_90 TaxID=1805281 RepID=A0A1J4V6L6_9BACT|nr:MAG: hypothetical protein AUJ77_01145 [Candidatus Nomurabacteria bacterium CG1_02_43_90]
MKLGKKINLVLVSVVVVVLTVAFWIIVNIEGNNLKSQVTHDADTVTGIFRTEIERMFKQIHNQEVYLQSAIDQMSKAQGVRYINVNGLDGKYIAATDNTLVGQKVKDAKTALLVGRTKQERTFVEIKTDEGTFYEMERFIPIFLDANDPQSKVINVIEVEVVTRTKSATDVSDAEKLLQVIAAGVEQNARAIILTYTEDVEALQQITSSVENFNFFNDFVVFDSKIDIIANTGNEVTEFSDDPIEYKQLREDVLAGKVPIGEVERIHEGKEVIMRVMPISTRDEKTGVVSNIGLLEVHILKNAYLSTVNELKIRMLGVGALVTAVLVAVLAVILEREVVGPIRRYSVIARKVADGDLTQKVESTSQDEIGQFGEVFNSMVANLRELDRLKSDFISVAAHQLRTPLSGVKWVLKLLLDGDLGAINDDQNGMLKRGYETNEKMIQLVNDLLNVSRIENDKFGYKFEKNDFMKLLETLRENIELPSREHNIDVRFENHAGDLPEFFFDPEKLLIALQNLVDNAIKYTLPGGSVTLVVSHRGGSVELKVSDTGVGIPSADLPKLFSKFFRAANVIHLQTDGSGLGLFIVKNIIIRHGGQIWVDSKEAEGTTFTVVIPILTELPEEKAETIRGKEENPRENMQEVQGNF